jgi:hypothetical protein
MSLKMQSNCCCSLLPATRHAAQTAATHSQAQAQQIDGTARAGEGVSEGE